MSTLRVQNIKDRPGTGQPTIDGLAKAWVNFNGTGTIAIRASYNVSSITDNGVGDYTVNFATPMPDIGFATNITPGGNTTGGLSLPATQTLTVNSVRMSLYQPYGSAGFYDSIVVSVSIFR